MKIVGSKWFVQMCHGVKNKHKNVEQYNSVLYQTKNDTKKNFYNALLQDLYVHFAI